MKALKINETDDLQKTKMTSFLNMFDICLIWLDLCSVALIICRTTVCAMLLVCYLFKQMFDYFCI